MNTGRDTICSTSCNSEMFPVHQCLIQVRKKLGAEETVFVKDIVSDDSTLELVSDTDELETFLELHEVEQTVFPPMFIMDITGIAETGILGTEIEENNRTPSVFNMDMFG